MVEYDDKDNLENHKWDILSYKGQLYYRETLYNYVQLNPKINVLLIRRYEE